MPVKEPDTSWLRTVVISVNAFSVRVMSSIAIIKDDRYLEHSAGEGHPESPNRLRVIHDLIQKEFPGPPADPAPSRDT